MEKQDYCMQIKYRRCNNKRIFKQLILSFNKLYNSLYNLEILKNTKKFIRTKNLTDCEQKHQLKHKNKLDKYTNSIMFQNIDQNVFNQLFASFDDKQII
ncbi:unnamed protein product [Paramecium primaurelia]|uniref:Uncharacterized protein n=1 Tax=Paramecium primaurelia TaxID=5886 RepID=A0A8S1MGY1_PARPR|nr:unnamed protein product [Paramecium primaurelia]